MIFSSPFHFKFFIAKCGGQNSGCDGIFSATKNSFYVVVVMVVLCSQYYTINMIYIMFYFWQPLILSFGFYSFCGCLLELVVICA